MLMALPRFGERRFKKRAAAAVPRRDRPSRLTAMRGDEREENGLSGAHERRMRHAALAPLRPGAARDRWDVNELRQRRSGSGRFQRAEIDVVAEIAPGIARQ